jgi:hypothetical protein
MRLVIELDEKHKNLFYEVIKVADARVIEEEPEYFMDYPEQVRERISRSLEQAEKGQTKSFKEVKEILSARWPSK